MFIKSLASKHTFLEGCSEDVGSICSPNQCVIPPRIMPHDWRVTHQNHKIVVPPWFVMIKKKPHTIAVGVLQQISFTTSYGINFINIQRRNLSQAPLPGKAALPLSNCFAFIISGSLANNLASFFLWHLGSSEATSWSVFCVLTLVGAFDKSTLDQSMKPAALLVTNHVAMGSRLSTIKWGQ